MAFVEKWQYICTLEKNRNRFFVMSKNETVDKNDIEDKKELQEDQVQDEQETLAEEVQEETNELEELQNKLEIEKDRNLRLFAEFENFRKRTAREKVEMFKTAGEDIMGSLLPVLDDFERALKELEKNEDDSLFIGVRLIQSKLRDTLRSKGLESIEVKPGDSFDADVHEAITKIPAPDKKLKGKIVDVVERGYTLGDKIIRYPKVVVGE